MYITCINYITIMSVAAAAAPADALAEQEAREMEKEMREMTTSVEALRGTNTC